MDRLSPEQLRAEFPAFQKLVFLGWAEMSVPPKRSVDAIQEYLSDSLTLTGARLHERWTEIADRSRTQIAQLLGANPDEIALTGSSTTQGIQIAFNAINPVRGQNVVTCDLEYILGGVELMKWAEKGVEVRVWKHRDGIYDIGDLAGLVDRNTRAVFLDSVTWINGYMFDIPEIARIAHESGAFLILDSIQHVGSMELDVKNAGADFIAVGGHKWLLSPFGCAFLYVSRKVAQSLEPRDIGYGNTDIPGGRRTFFRRTDVMPISTYPMVKSSKKFEYGGVHSPLTLTGLATSVEMLNAAGIENIQERILRLKALLVTELEGIGARVVPPLQGEHASGITLFNLGKDVQDDYRLVEKLLASGITVSARGSTGIGGIRASVHYANNEADVVRFVEALKELKNEG